MIAYKTLEKEFDVFKTLTKRELDALPIGSRVTHYGKIRKGSSPYFTKAANPANLPTEFCWVDSYRHKSWGGGWETSERLAEYGMVLVPGEFDA
jgi:hypothetical protein